MCLDDAEFYLFCLLGQQLPIQPIHGSSGSIEANCNRPESNLGLLWGLTIGTGYKPSLSFQLNRDAVTAVTRLPRSRVSMTRWFDIVRIAIKSYNFDETISE